MDAREAARDDRGAAEQPRRQRGVLAAAAFAVVRVADDDPLHALRLVVARDRRRSSAPVSPVSTFDRLAALAGVGVDRAHEQVVAELVEVAAVAQPRAGGRDVVGRRLALGLQSTGMSMKSLPSHAGHGSISCSRSLVGRSPSSMLLPSSGGAT